MKKKVLNLRIKSSICKSYPQPVFWWNKKFEVFVYMSFHIRRFFQKAWNAVCFPVDYCCIGAVWCYKIFISPFKPKVCRFQPTCSSYMIDAIKHFHFYKGCFIGLNRLLRCTPKTQGGYDPVPLNLRGKERYLFWEAGPPFQLTSDKWQLTIMVEFR